VTARSVGFTTFLRGGVLGLLAMAFLLGPEGDTPAGGEGSALLEPDPDTGAWRAAGPGTVLAVRRSLEAPSPGELEMLEGVGRRVPLLAALPRGTGVRAEAPRAPRAERVTALPFEVRGGGGEVVTVRLLDGAGVVDSLALPLDGSGRGEGAFRLRPARAGWQEWRVAVDGVGSQVVGAWVREAAPLRALVASGPPGWESRFLLRALDEAGVESAVVLPLGQGFHAGALEAIPSAPGALDGIDVVVILPGAAVDAATGRALEAFTVAGGGVVAVGHPELWRALGVVSEGQAGPPEPVSVAGAAIGWGLPPELTPLPEAELRSEALPLGRLEPLAFPVAGTESGPLLALRPLGGGRVAALGVLESWRWRMEAGRVEEHREFWSGLLHWLAGVGDDAPPVHLATGVGPIGVPVVLERSSLQDGEGDLPFRLERPDGRSEPIRPASGRAGEPLRGAFLPGVGGIHRIEGWAGATPAGFRALEPGDPGERRGDAVARLALLAHRSGGGLVGPEALDRAVEDRLAAAGRGAGARLPWLLLAGIVALALGEWTVRRLSGRP
jgi:hypothetical protein